MRRFAVLPGAKKGEIGAAMIRGVHTSGTAMQRVALMLVACALLLRILVPAGWMPVANASGIAFNWCSDSSGSAVQLRAAALLSKAVGKEQAPDPAPASDHQPCAFAAAAQPVTGVAAAELAPPPAPDRVAALPRLTAVPGRGLAAPPPLSTGPPLLA